MDSGEQQPILVGAEDSDDDVALSTPSRGDRQQRELQMTNLSTDNGRTAATRQERRETNGSIARQNGHGGGGVNGSVAMGGGRLSRGPSAANSPIAPKRKKGVGGIYARVGGDGANGAEEGQEYGMFGSSPEMVGFEEGGGGGGRGFGDGAEGEDGYHNLALGRTGEVEGQMEAGGGGRRWDGDSDSSDDGRLIGGEAGVDNGLVEPA